MTSKAYAMNYVMTSVRHQNNDIKIKYTYLFSSISPTSKIVMFFASV